MTDLERFARKYLLCICFDFANLWMIGFIALPFCPSPATQVLFKIGIMDQVDLRGVSTAATGSTPRGVIVLKEEI